jgi:hypothetical protein
MKIHDVQVIDFQGNRMILTVDGKTYNVDLAAVSARLAGAEDSARRVFSVAPSGYGIHWPEVDEDLTIHGLTISTRAHQ